MYRIVMENYSKKFAIHTKNLLKKEQSFLSFITQKIITGKFIEIKF